MNSKGRDDELHFTDKETECRNAHKDKTEEDSKDPIRYPLPCPSTTPSLPKSPSDGEKAGLFERHLVKLLAQ